MSSAERLAVLEVTQRNELESLLMEFDQAWTSDSLDEFSKRVASHPNERFRATALAEVVKIDMQRSWSAGRRRLLDEYLQRCPLLGTSDSVDVDLIVCEFDARRNTGSSVELASYESRFPNQFCKVVELVGRLSESRISDRPATESEHPIQASIDTSKIDKLRDTTAGIKKVAPVDLPVEFGRYRILKELGSGAMGKVYLAHDSRLDRQVALKTPSFSGPSDQDLVTRFYREARSAAKLQHRNICPVYDVGEINGRHFISMAFVKGRCMSHFINPGKVPPPKTSAILIHRLATALAEAHRHKVIHRDLKPANIMIDLKREPIVMDFGLARQTDAESRLTQSGMAVGTPAYMSPEQIRGKLDEVGPASDIYSLGVILYELLTGKIPFQGSIAQVVYKIVNEEPISPTEFAAEIDPRLEAICGKMIAKDLSQRYQSMNDVAKDLNDYVKGRKEPTSQTAGSWRQSPTETQQRQDPKSKSAEPDLENVSETGALNAFFATQSADPTHTAVESRASDRPVLLSQPQVQPSRKRRGNRSKLIAAGLIGILVLAGVTIYFADGSKVEIEDGVSAKVETNPNGTLKSITTELGPATAAKSPTQHAVEAREFQSDLAVSTGEAGHPPTSIEMNVGTGVAALAISPDDQTLAVSGYGLPGLIQTWDLQTGKKKSSLVAENGSFGHLAYSPDGQTILSGTGGTVSRWDIKSGKIVQSFRFPDKVRYLGVFQSKPWAVALSRTSSEAGRQDKSEIPSLIRIWNWETGEVLAEQQETPDSWNLSLSPDDRLVTLGLRHNHKRFVVKIDDNEVQLVNAMVLEKANLVRSRISFSPDGKYGACNVKWGQALFVLWNMETGSLYRRFDRETAASAEKNNFAASVAFSPSGATIASGDFYGRVRLWNRDTGELISELHRHRVNKLSNDGEPPLVTFTRDGRLVSGGGPSDRSVRVVTLADQ